jgi:hypothetical protein
LSFFLCLKPWQHCLFLYWRPRPTAPATGGGGFLHVTTTFILVVFVVVVVDYLRLATVGAAVVCHGSMVATVVGGGLSMAAAVVSYLLWQGLSVTIAGGKKITQNQCYKFTSLSRENGV